MRHVRLFVVSQESGGRLAYAHQIDLTSLLAEELLNRCMQRNDTLAHPERSHRRGPFQMEMTVVNGVAYILVAAKSCIFEQGSEIYAMAISTRPTQQGSPVRWISEPLFPQTTCKLLAAPIVHIASRTMLCAVYRKVSFDEMNSSPRKKYVEVWGMEIATGVPKWKVCLGNLERHDDQETIKYAERRRLRCWRVMGDVLHVLFDGQIARGGESAMVYAAVRASDGEIVSFNQVERKPLEGDYFQSRFECAEVYSGDLLCVLDFDIDWEEENGVPYRIVMLGYD